MNKRLFLILILFCIWGCSVPRVAQYTHIYSYTREEKIIKTTLSGKKKFVSVKDFRENERFDEHITALKDKVENFVASNPHLREEAKNNLRELKVMEGSTKTEVELLLGEPDKIIKKEGEVGSLSETWIYRISKINTFGVFIIPLFFTHEGYYIYFKDNLVTAIERHYLTQTLQASDPGMGNKKSED